MKTLVDVRHDTKMNKNGTNKRHHQKGNFNHN